MDLATPNFRRPFWTPHTISRYADAFAKVESTTKAAPLILGLVANYSALQLAPFVISLRQVDFKGQVVFLVSNLSPETLTFLQRAGIETLPFDPKKYTPFHIQNARWFHYLDYLMERLLAGSLPSSVFFTDVRDVVFQADPLSGPLAPIEIFYENAQPLIGECPVNSKWLKTCFGETAAHEFRDKQISCSGTVMGSGRGTLDYLITMWNVMSLMSDEAARSIADQAVHNFITHRNLVDNMRCNTNGGRVLTLHYTDAKTFMLDGSGMIRNGDGSICPIVHQYDRHPILTRVVQERCGMPVT